MNKSMVLTTALNESGTIFVSSSDLGFKYFGLMKSVNGEVRYETASRINVAGSGVPQLVLFMINVSTNVSK